MINFRGMRTTSLSGEKHVIGDQRYVEIEQAEYARLKEIEKNNTEQVFLRVPKRIVRGIEKYFHYGKTAGKINDALIFSIASKEYFHDFLDMKNEFERNVEEIRKKYAENPHVENEKMCIGEIKNRRKEYLQDIEIYVNSMIDELKNL